MAADSDAPCSTSIRTAARTRRELRVRRSGRPGSYSARRIGKPGVDHRGELPREDRDLLQLHLLGRSSSMFRPRFCLPTSSGVKPCSRRRCSDQGFVVGDERARDQVPAAVADLVGVGVRHRSLTSHPAHGHAAHAAAAQRVVVSRAAPGPPRRQKACGRADQPLELLGVVAALERHLLGDAARLHVARRATCPSSASRSARPPASRE